MRRVVLILGPPGAGKTTLARSLGLTVYDRDDARWSSEQQFRRALTRLGQDPAAQAAVIRSGATRTSRANAARLVAATETRMLLVPPDVSRDRITHRANRPASVRTQLAALDTWWARYQPDGTTPADSPPARPPGRHWSNDRAYRVNRTLLLRASTRDQAPCARCGGPIDYDGPRYLHLSGRRVENPAAFDAGHIMALIEGGTHALDNLQPEHARCNRSAGAHLGNSRRPGHHHAPHHQSTPQMVGPPLILDDW